MEEYRHPEKEYLVRYMISADGLHVKEIEPVVKEIQQNALKMIEVIKKTNTSEERKQRFRLGIKLAFWLHQYANASLILQEN